VALYGVDRLIEDKEDQKAGTRSNMYEDVIRGREELSEQIKALKELKKLGFSFEDSKSNFIFATHKSVPAGKIFQALRERHIYVRYFEKPRIDNYLRITIGTREEMQTLFDFLKDYLTESSK